MISKVRAWWHRNICDPTPQPGYHSYLDLLDRTRFEEDWDT